MCSKAVFFCVARYRFLSWTSRLVRIRPYRLSRFKVIIKFTFIGNNVDNQALAQNGNDCTWKKGALSVERVATANLPTAYGQFQIAGYRSLTSEEEFVALYKGDLKSEI